MRSLTGKCRRILEQKEKTSQCWKLLRVSQCFSNSIHQIKTKEIIKVKEVW